MPFTTSGRDLSWTTEPLPSISVSWGERPLAVTMSESSAGRPVEQSLVVSGPSSAPTRSAVRPSLR
jgi:hypothetical protein